MKKVVAMLSALTLTLAMGVTAFAADENIALGKTPMVNITNVKTADGNGSWTGIRTLAGACRRMTPRSARRTAPMA